MNHEIHLDLDPASDQFKELQDAYLNDKTYTIERGGVTYTGCRITSIRLEGPGNDVRGYVTLTAPFNSALPEIVSTPEGRNAYRDLSEQDYSKVEARTLAWLDDNQQFGGKPFAIEKMNLHPSQYEFFKAGRRCGKSGWLESEKIHEQLRLGAHYSHKMEYAKGGPWKRPGVGFYPNKPFGENSMFNRHWEFKSAHPKDIDFDELTGSVTRQDPIALVKGAHTEQVTKQRPKRDKAGNPIIRDVYDHDLDADKPIYSDPARPGALVIDAVPVLEDYTASVEREENYVVVHRSLYDKGLVARIDLPTTKAPKLANSVGARVYAGVKTAEFRNWIAWAKEVKAAKWDDGRKATFEVDLPTI